MICAQIIRKADKVIMTTEFFAYDNTISEQINRIRTLQKMRVIAMKNDIKNKKDYTVEVTLKN